MTATFYICMTSGIRGPELELTDEQVEPIVKLVESLTQPWDGSTLVRHRMPAPDHYAVSWKDGDTHCDLWTESSGFVRIYKKGDTDWTEYRDTVGLWAHLASHASVAHQKWAEDMKKAEDADYDENGIFRDWGSRK